MDAARVARMAVTRRHLWWIGLAAALLGAVSAGLVLFAALGTRAPPASAESFAYRPPPSSDALPTLWKAPDFSFEDQTGKRRTLEDLGGKVWIADFVFTTCTTVCPLISAKRVLLQRRLLDPDLRFVSFSVDPGHDTPAVLADYARSWNPDERRWLLFSTDEKGLAATAAGMRVALERTGDAADPILHSRMFFLVDRVGQVRGVYDSNDDEALRRLTRDAEKLLGRSGASPAGLDAKATGEELFGALGCAACHDDPKLAPSLAGLAGRRVELEGGGAVSADAAYLEESIVAPGSKRVAGYLNLMPSYANELSPEQLRRLVEHVQHLAPATDPPAPSAAAMAIDPVCHMQVRATDEVPHVEHDGTTYYFCSEPCRDRFQKDPAKYTTR
jgi:protein SCO1/2